MEVSPENIDTDETALERALRRLLPTEGGFRLLLASDHVGIGLVDDEGSLLDANRPLLEMLGLLRQELTDGAFRISELTPADHRQADELAAAEIATEGVCRPYRKELFRSDGARIPVLTAMVTTPLGERILFALRAGADARRERHLPLQYAVTRILGEASSLGGAARSVIERVCMEIGWDAGTLWILDPTEHRLRCVEAWSREEELFAPLMSASLEHAFERGVGLPGQVWESGRAAWIEDVTMGSEFTRREATIESSVRSAASVPVMVDGAINGVIELYTTTPQRESPTLLEFFAGIGGQIGQYIERKRAERAITEGAERFRALIEHSWEAVALIDRTGALLYSSPPGMRLLGYVPETLYGHNVFELIHPDDIPATLLRFEELLAHPGERAVAEYRFRHADGEWIWLEAGATNMLEEPSLRAIVVNYRDITERKKIEERIRFLAGTGTLLAESLDYQKTLRRVVELAVPTFADWCSVLTVDADCAIEEFVVANADPERERWGREMFLRYPPKPGFNGCFHALRTRESILGGAIPDEQLVELAHDAEHLAMLRAAGIQSYIVVPMVARGEVMGLFGLFIDESPRRYAEEDRLLAVEIANRAAAAIDNARLYAAERLARRQAEEATNRSGRLQQITASLSEAINSSQVATVVLHQGVESLNAETAVLALLDRERDWFEVLGTLGVPEQILENWHGFAASGSTPIADAARAAAPVWIGTRQEFDLAYPHLINVPVLAGQGARCALPLIVDGRVLGGLGICFPTPRAFSEEEKAFAMALARQCAQALERTRLYDAERSARAAADAAARRSAFLAEASKVLASSLDVESTLGALTRLAIPELADVCVIDLLPQSGWRIPPVMAMGGQTPPPLARYLNDPLQMSSRYGFRKVTTTSRPELVRTFDGAVDAEVEMPSEHRTMLAELGITSYLCVPITARSEMLGALTLVWTNPALRYDERDLALAEDVAARIALAIDNARLYRMAQEELAERKRTERALVQSNARFLRLFESSIIGIIVADLDGMVTEANDAFLDMVGFTREDLREGKIKWMQMTPARYYRRERQAATESQATGAFSPYEKEFVRKDGALVPVLIGGATIGDDGRRLICFVVDLTERRKGEKERLDLLHREQSARREAETANRLKDEFLATVSHELRTPLNAILGWVQLLRTGELDPETNERALETIERNAKAQTQIIEDILDVSRIVSGKIRLEMLPVELAPVVNAALDAFRLAAEARQITLVLNCQEEPAQVLGDAQRLQQVVWNLLSNAIKFTPQGGRVEIGLARIGRSAEVRVTDTGKGIAPEFLPYVFDRFRQADGSNTRPHGGLGLGLAIVRHLVELHGGSVMAQSDGDGTGATFRVRIPLRSSRAETLRLDGADGRDGDALPATGRLGDPAGADGAPPERLDGVRVLAVDDEADTLEMVRTALERRGAIVTTAASAAAAFRAFTLARPELVISDIGMPEEDGYTLIERIRRAEGTVGRPVPAIALTAYARSEDSARALRAGFNVHMAKPVEPALLIRIAARLLGSPASGGITR